MTLEELEQLPSGAKLNDGWEVFRSWECTQIIRPVDIPIEQTSSVYIVEGGSMVYFPPTHKYYFNPKYRENQLYEVLNYEDDILAEMEVVSDV